RRDRQPAPANALQRRSTAGSNPALGLRAGHGGSFGLSHAAGLSLPNGEEKRACAGSLHPKPVSIPRAWKDVFTEVGHLFSTSGWEWATASPLGPHPPGGNRGARRGTRFARRRPPRRVPGGPPGVPRSAGPDQAPPLAPPTAGPVRGGQPDRGQRAVA